MTIFCLMSGATKQDIIWSKNMRGSNGVVSTVFKTRANRLRYFGYVIRRVRVIIRDNLPTSKWNFTNEHG